MAHAEILASPKTHCAAVEFHGWHAPCGKLDHKRSRPVPGLNRPKRVRRTDNGIDEPACLCGYRVWVERGKRRRRPDSGAAYLASVGPVTVLYYPSLCRSSSPRQTYGAAVGCSKLLTFQTSSKPFLNRQIAYPRPLRVINGPDRAETGLLNCPRERIFAALFGVSQTCQ